MWFTRYRQIYFIGWTYMINDVNLLNTCMTKIKEFIREKKNRQKAKKKIENMICLWYNNET